jgi:rubrerythrin
MADITTPKQALRQAIRDEKKAQVDYLRWAKMATNEHDKAAAKMFKHIATEERHHEHELKRLLEQR